MFKKIFIIIILILSFIVYKSFYTVDETQYAVVTQFGKPIKIVKVAGLNMKSPLQTVNYFEKRVEVVRTEPVQFLLKENKPIILSTFIAWKIDDPLLYFQTIGKLNSSSSKLKDMVNSYLGNLLGLYKIEEIINIDTKKIKIQKIKDNLITKTNKESKEKYGIEIVEIGFVRIAYPSLVTKAVYGRMKAERETEAKRLRALGREKAQDIKVKADKDAKKILAEANKKAIIIKGEGEAEAMQIYGKAYSKSYDYFNFIKSLETYEKILKNKTTLILSTDSKLFKFFEGNIK